MSRGRRLTQEELAEKRAAREAWEANLTDEEKEAIEFDKKADGWRTVASEIWQIREEVERLNPSRSEERKILRMLNDAHEKATWAADNAENWAHQKRTGFFKGQ